MAAEPKREELLQKLEQAQADLNSINTEIEVATAQLTSLNERKTAVVAQIASLEDSIGKLVKPVIVTFDIWNLDTNKYVTWIDGNTIDLKNLPARVGFGIPTKDTRKISYNINGTTGEMNETFPNIFIVPVALTPGVYKVTITPEGGSPVVKEFKVVNTGSTSGPVKPQPKPNPPEENFPTTVTVNPFQTVHFKAPDSFLKGKDPQLSDPKWNHTGTEDQRLMPAEYVSFGAAACYKIPGEYGLYFKGAPFAKIIVTEDKREKVTVRTFADLKSAATTPNRVITFNPSSNEVEVPDTIKVADNVHIKASRSGIALLGTYKKEWQSMFLPGKKVTVQGFVIRHKEGAGHPNKINRQAFIGADNLTVLNCVVGDIGIFINCDNKPTGVFVGGCTEEHNQALKMYFCWVEGTSFFFTRNKMTNSTREHIIRAGGGLRPDGTPASHFVTIVDNDLGNEDLRPGDPYDYSKGALSLQTTMWTSVYNNRITGPAALGPLGEADGFNHPEHRGKYAIYQKNKNTHQGLMNIDHGQSHVYLKDNIFDSTYHKDGSLDLNIEGWEPTFKRGVEDVVLDNNTGDIRVSDSVTGRLVVKNHRGTISYAGKVVESINKVSEEEEVVWRQK